MRFWLALSAGLAASTSAFPDPKLKAPRTALGERQNAERDLSPLVVDLGYERYLGVVDGSTGIKTWKGYEYILDQGQNVSNREA